MTSGSELSVHRGHETTTPECHGALIFCTNPIVAVARSMDPGARGKAKQRVVQCDRNMPDIITRSAIEVLAMFVLYGYDFFGDVTVCTF